MPRHRKRILVRQQNLFSARPTPHPSHERYGKVHLHIQRSLSRRTVQCPSQLSHAFVVPLDSARHHNSLSSAPLADHSTEPSTIIKQCSHSLIPKFSCIKHLRNTAPGSRTALTAGILARRRSTTITTAFLCCKIERNISHGP